MIDRPSPGPAGKIQMISPTKPQGGSAGATPAYRQAKILQTCSLQSHSVSRGTRRLWCYGSVPTAPPDFTPDALKEKQGVSGNLAPATWPLWQVITILCFTSPTHKSRITISPLNTFSPFDGSCYNYIAIAGYLISFIALWWSVQMNNLSILQTNRYTEVLEK